MKQNLAELYLKNPRKACELALRRTEKVEKNKRIDEINLLLGLNGVEAIRGDWQNGRWGDVVAVYCNTGDTYKLTVIEQRGETKFDNSTFFVCSMGDFVENNSEKLGII